MAQQQSNKQDFFDMTNDSLIKLLLELNTGVSETKATLKSIQDQVNSLSEQVSEVSKSLNEHLESTDEDVAKVNHKAESALSKIEDQEKHANFNFNVLASILIPVLIAIIPLLISHFHFY